MKHASSRTIVLVICMVLAPLCLASSSGIEEFKKLYSDYSQCIADGMKGCVKEAKLVFDVGESLFKTPGNKIYATISYNYGRALLHDGSGEQATETIDALDDSLRLISASFGKRSDEAINNLYDLVRAFYVYSKANRSGKEKYIQKYFSADYEGRLISLAKKRFGNESEEYVAVLSTLAGIAESYGIQYEDKVTKKMARAYQWYASQEGSNPYDQLMLALYLGKAHNYGKRKGVSERYFLDVIEFSNLLDDQVKKFGLVARILLVEIYEEWGDRKKATEHCLAIGLLSSENGNGDYYAVLRKLPEAPRSTMQGSVVVEFDVSSQGVVENVRLVESTGHEELIEVTISAVSNFRYAPKYVNYQPVRVTGVRNKITFERVWN